MHNIQELVKNSSIFSGLKPPELEIISGYSEVLQLEEGDSIFEAGSSGEELYIVQKGEVLITRRTREGKELDIARIIPGEMFGEMEFFQSSRHNASARALKKSVLLQFPKEGINFEDLLGKQPSISAHLLHKFLTVIAGRIRSTNKLVAENSPVVQELRKQVYGDKLTGLFNRTYLEEQLHTFLREPQKPVSLVMIKPDNFKYINDTFGHEAGDNILQLLGAAYSAMIGEEDVAVRFMGNEFGLVLRNTEREGARDFAKKLQQMVRDLDLQEEVDNKNFHLTVSIGIAVYPEHALDADTLIRLAHELPLVGRGRGGGKILFPEDKTDEEQNPARDEGIN